MYSFCLRAQHISLSLVSTSHLSSFIILAYTSQWSTVILHFLRPVVSNSILAQPDFTSGLDRRFHIRLINQKSLSLGIIPPSGVAVKNPRAQYRHQTLEFPTIVSVSGDCMNFFPEIEVHQWRLVSGRSQHMLSGLDNFQLFEGKQ